MKCQPKGQMVRKRETEGGINNKNEAMVGKKEIGKRNLFMQDCQKTLLSIHYETYPLE